MATQPSSDGYNFINTHAARDHRDYRNQDLERCKQPGWQASGKHYCNPSCKWHREVTRQAVTADEAGNWTYTFKDLPKYANGQEITYTVAEEEVTDYTTTYDGSNITNSYTPGKTSATVTKIWN